jgi:hypothetical protein
MATFIPYIPKPPNASNQKPSNSPKYYLPIESSDVLVEMLPPSRGAKSEKNWQGIAAGEGIARGAQGMCSNPQY